MKKSSPTPVANRAAARELSAKLATAKQRTHDAKAELKRARKAFKKAKKCAKETRKEAKILKKQLVALQASLVKQTKATKSRTAAPTKRNKRVRPIASAKPVAHPAAIVVIPGQSPATETSPLPNVDASADQNSITPPAGN